MLNLKSRQFSLVILGLIIALGLGILVSKTLRQNEEAFLERQAPQIVWASCEQTVDKNRYEVVVYDTKSKLHLFALAHGQALPKTCVSSEKPSLEKIPPEVISKFNSEKRLELMVYEYEQNQVQSRRDQFTFGELIDWASKSKSLFSQALSPVESFQLIITHNTLDEGRGNLSQLQGTESGTWALQTAKVWDQGVFGNGELISFADTGLNLGDQGVHEDLINQFVGGATYAPGETSWMDHHGHGSNVVGLSVGAGIMSGGLVTGVAPQAQFLVQSIWSRQLNNFFVPSNLPNFFYDAYEAGARIHVNSWGSGQELGVYNGMSYDFDRFAYEYPDMLFVTAVGNFAGDWDANGQVDMGSIASPSTAKNVLSVGASENLVSTGGIQQPLSQLRTFSNRFPVEPLASDHPSDNLQGVASFSGRGPTLDGRIKPEILAPGTNLLSTRSRAPGSKGLWGGFNKDYNWTGGTSMAAPLVAGVAALVRQTLKAVHNQRQPSSALVKAVLMNSAFDLFPGQFGPGGAQEIPSRRPNVVEGFGLVQADNSVFINPLLLVDEKQGVSQGQAKAYEFTLSQSSSLAMTLVWTDFPAQPGSQKALVNNLNLELVDVRGQRVVYSDALNNFEHADISLEAGRYQVRVLGQEVPVGPQSYALILALKN